MLIIIYILTDLSNFGFSFSYIDFGKEYNYFNHNMIF